MCWEDSSSSSSSSDQDDDDDDDANGGGQGTSISDTGLQNSLSKSPAIRAGTSTPSVSREEGGVR